VVFSSSLCFVSNKHAKSWIKDHLSWVRQSIDSAVVNVKILFLSDLKGMKLQSFVQLVEP
ncbi:MAG: hypothetical protein RLZZ337_1953, partial [Bacteroidota bacterium]